MRRLVVATAVVIAGLVGACSGGSASPAPAASAQAAASVPAPSAAVGSAASAVGAGSTGTAVGPGQNLCALLGPGDFAAQGITGAGTPTLNGNGTTEAYCSYTSKSSAQGGIEFDAFAGSKADAPSTYATIVGSSATNQDAKAKLSGVDAAAIDLNAEGGSATIAVQAGALVFDIGFPKSDKAEAQLLALAQLVLERGAGLR